jgi:PKD repeat protein
MTRSRLPLAALLILGVWFIIHTAGAVSLTIDYPSPNETTMAEMRDFYVTGAIPAGITTPGDLRIEVFSGASAAGTPVRTLESHVDPLTGTTPRSAIAADYPNGSAKGTVMVPDLVSEPGGLLETWNKVIVTPEYYSGLVLGGVTKQFDTTYTDRDGRPLHDLVAGEYTIRVTGLSGGLHGLTAEKRVTLGKTHAALGRFSPPAQLNRLTAFARENGYRTYIDSFPGYFFWNNTGYVIPGRWVRNNAIEVVNDCPGTTVDMVGAAENDLFLYNIRTTSATYTIETSTLIRTGMVDSPQTVYHYYTSGEPVYTYTARENGSRVSFDSTLATLAYGDRLVLTRAELRMENDTDPIVDLSDTTQKRLDLLPGDGIDLEPGETCLLYGVVAPIPAPVVPGPSGKDGTPTNRIASIDWTLVDAGGAAVANSTIPVELGRRIDPAKPSEITTSLYEFGGAIGTGMPPGRYTLCIVGRDEIGAAVDGTTEEVPFCINAAPTPTPEPYTVHPIPGRIEGEDYDLGGEGVAYHDTTAGNEGGVYRQDDVDIEMTTGEETPNVGWVRDGEWLRYTANVTRNGNYTVTARVASPHPGRQIVLSVSGGDTVQIEVPNTGSFATFANVTVPIHLTAGTHSLVLTFFGDGQNVDWLTFTQETVPMKIVPGGSGIPLDLNGDGRYEDVNGNGVFDFTDVVLFFNQMDWIEANEPVAGFDFNGDDRIDFNDIVIQFNEV